MWSQRQSKAPRYSDHNMERYMRKLLIYYPKNLKALLPITAEANSKLADLSYDDGESIEQELTRIETLYMQILAKYKGSYIRHQNIDISFKDPYTYRPNRLETLRFYQSDEYVRLKIPDVLIRALRLSKGVKHLEIDNSVTCYPDILKNAKYIPGLESIFIHNHHRVTSLAIKALEKLFLVNKLTLKTITLVGVFPVNPKKFLRILSGLPKLKTVTLEGEFPIKFDVRKIPFQMFKDRGISFHVKLKHSKSELKFTTKNKPGPLPFDLLRLNYQVNWEHMSQFWDFLVEQKSETCGKAKRGVTLDFSAAHPKIVRVSKLLRACKDVEVLGIGLMNALYNWKGKEFINLKYLKKLKHVHIELDNAAVNLRKAGDQTIACYDGFFRNLAFCASTLRSISLHLHGEIDVKDRLTKLFKACANTLNHVTLKFSCNSNAIAKNMDGSYNCLKELKQLISLKIIYVGFNSTTFAHHANRIPFICPTLKEIFLMAPFAYIFQLNLNFKHLTDLEKVQLSFASFDDYTGKLKVFPNKFLIPGSVRLLGLDIFCLSESAWYKLLAEFRRLPKLEILMLRVRLMLDNTKHYMEEHMLINDIKTVMKGHKSLKCVVYGFGADQDTVIVFVEDTVCCSDEDIDRFYGINRMEIPRRRMQRVYKVKKEITEEIIMSEEPVVEVNRGFTGFLKDLFSKMKSYYDRVNG